jgi:hypothetical protein
VEKVPVKVDPPAPAPALEPKEVKTPSNELLAALKEEREKRRDLERELSELKGSKDRSLPEGDMSDEGLALKQQIDELQKTINQMKLREELSQVLVSYPQLKDKQSEFEAYRAGKPEYDLKDAALLFITENNLTEVKPSRKGLERPSGGSKTPNNTGQISAADVDRIRSTQPRLFIQMVRDGRIDPDQIK